ncbi:MAG: hypothetical protein ACXVCP_06635 [Bdellovibrio sp.]
MLNRLFFQFILNRAQAGAPCADAIVGLAAESLDSPFFEHFHQLVIPVEALIRIPKNGIQLKTTPVDAGSYDNEQLEKFLKESKLDREKLLTHTHDVFIDQTALDRIAKGEKNVEVRVISGRGNYVHNFMFTASPAIKAKIKRQSKQ